MIAVSAFITAMFTAGLVSAQGAMPPADLEQLAQRIAATIEATTPHGSADSVITQKASSHGNIVEIRTSLQSGSAFAKISADRIAYESGLIRFYCRPERLEYIQKGVVFHYVVAGPGGSGFFDFSIDDKACASSAHSRGSDNPTVATTAQDLSQKIATALSKEQNAGGLRYESTTVRGEEVQVTEIVESTELADRIKKQDYQFRGITQGWFCGRFGNEIRSGIRVHVIYMSRSGQSILDIPVDGSGC